MNPRHQLIKTITKYVLPLAGSKIASQAQAMFKNICWLAWITVYNIMQGPEKRKNFHVKPMLIK